MKRITADIIPLEPKLSIAEEAIVEVCVDVIIKMMINGEAGLQEGGKGLVKQQAIPSQLPE